MAAKKKTRKKQTRSKRAADKKVMPTKKLAKKGAILKKNSAKKKRAHRRSAVEAKAVAKGRIGAKAVRAPQRRGQGKGQTLDRVASSPERPRAGSAGQSGDLQGLSSIERADSESVDELLEEGNAFEADVVAGVEEAGNADEEEVRTHEVPEDDVPGEYLDKD